MVLHPRCVKVKGIVWCPLQRRYRKPFGKPFKEFVGLSLCLLLSLRVAEWWATQSSAARDSTVRYSTVRVQRSTTLQHNAEQRETTTSHPYLNHRRIKKEKVTEKQ